MLSEYRRIRKNLLENNIEHIYGALEFSSDGIYICDQDGITLYVNPAYEEITGLKRKEILGRSLKDLSKENKFNISASLCVLDKKEPVSLMHRYISGKSALTTASPIYDYDNNMMGVVCNTRNIEQLTDLKKELHKVKLKSQNYSEELKLLRKEQFSIEGLVYKSKEMDETLKLALKASKFDSTILITGESGTGKEVLAKFIYQNSIRKDKPFIKVNCAAIPKELFESELFGYVKGAFTGASDKGKTGMFELANEGTILLDEIGELPISIQSKLLRVIQEQEIYRVGGEDSIKLDVRIIASTNKNLENEVEKKRFREDLYFRLNVVPIKIPSLKERKKDIPEIIGYFMKKLNNKYNKNIIISKKALDILLEYNWPGNVRELENIIEYMFIMNSREEIDFEQLPDKILNEHILKSKKHELGNRGKLEYLMEVYEKNILTSAVEKHDSIRKAAKTLGINYSTLYRKINKYNIDTVNK